VGEFRNLHRRDVEIDDQPLLATSGQHAAQLHLLARVDFLMRYVGGHVDEIPRPRLGDEFQPLAPAQARKAADHVDHAFEIAVMVRSRLRFRLDGDRAGPQFPGTGACSRDRRAPLHAECLRGGIVQLIGPDDSHALGAPSTGVLAHPFSLTF